MTGNRRRRPSLILLHNQICIAIESLQKNPLNPATVCSKKIEEAKTSNQRAIWIASFPRSANTWIRVFPDNPADRLGGGGDRRRDTEAIAGAFSRALGKPVAEATPAEIAAERCAVQAELVRG